MEVNHVKGVNKGNVMLYALSTCAWCKKTKALLNSMNVEYSSIDVDLLKGGERDKVIEDLKKWNPRCSFPTLVINDISVVGYKEDEIREVLS